jgi:hypothetical protein
LRRGGFFGGAPYSLKRGQVFELFPRLQWPDHFTLIEPTIVLWFALRHVPKILRDLIWSRERKENQGEGRRLKQRDKTGKQDNAKLKASCNTRFSSGH